jgi:hypothetical protein
MLKVLAPQQVQPPRRKKIDRAFSRKKRENALKKAVDNTLVRPKRETALQLADVLCLLANAQVSEVSEWTDICKATQKSKLRDRVAAVFDFLGKSECKANLDEILHYSDSPDYECAIARYEGRIDDETERAVSTLRWCRKLARDLTLFIMNREYGYEFLIQEEKVSSGHIDPATGKVVRGPFSLRGQYQDIFVRVVDHPKFDGRRLKFCAVCRGFFYQRRLRSRACIGKCANLLMVREHLERRRTALRLKEEGKSISEIAAVLDVTPFQVRRLLKKP